MVKKAETKFKEEVLAEINKIPNCWAFKAQEVGRRGIPDILGCVNGTFFALELKTDVGHVDKLQQHTLAKIKQAGGYSTVLMPSNFIMVYSTLLALSCQSLEQCQVVGVS